MQPDVTPKSVDPKRLEAILNLTIKSGKHDSFAKGACVMEAVAFVAGERHTDSPECACPVLAAFLRQFNDRLPNDKVRSELLTALIPKLVGSRIGEVVEEKRRCLMVDWCVHVLAPRWFELANKAEAAAKLRALPTVTPKNRRDIGEKVWAIRCEAFGDNSPWWTWRNQHYSKVYDAVYAAVSKELKGGKPFSATATAADAAATDAAATTATADATTAATAAAATDAATDAAATTAKIPEYGTTKYWAWRDALRKQVYEKTYAAFYERMDAAFTGAVERSRKEAVDLVERCLAITE